MNVLQILLFFSFSIFLAFVLSKSPFLRKNGLSPFWITMLFFTKLIAGICYLLFGLGSKDFYNRVDTWRYFRNSLIETDILRNNPIFFLQDLFKPRYTTDSGIFGVKNSLLNDIKELIPIKLEAILNFISFSSIEVNVVLFNFLVFYGQLALAFTWAKALKVQPILAVFCTILFPSVLFWNSGFHRDGLLLMALGWCCWFGFSLLTDSKKPTSKILGFLVSFLLLFLLRNYFALLIFFSAILTYLGFRYLQKPMNFKQAGLILIIVLGGLWMMERFQISKILYEKQQSFLLLPGDSRLSPLLASAQFSDFLLAIPKAAYRGILAPLPIQPLRKMEWPPAIETLLLILLSTYIAVFGRLRNTNRFGTMWLRFGLLSALFTCLIIGFTAPFLGSIVRYRSFIYPLCIPYILIGFSNQFLKRTNYISKNTHIEKFLQNIQKL